ncbi:MAG: response regulator [Proteobacteria bacterium]|nr:response regulator [Pseudomonadota bacterium]
MQLEEEQTALNPESSPGPVEDQQDETTKWLLDRDLSEPVENLFTMDDAPVDAALTEFEVEIAGRPMFRGHGDGDDISAILDEEIIVTEVGGESDIYAASKADATEGEIKEQKETPLAVDHSSLHGATDTPSEVLVADGEDILSLSDDDDMGDHYLVLVKSGGKAKATEVEATEVEATMQAESAAAPVLDLELGVEAELESGFDISLDIELDLTGIAEPEAESEPELASVTDYISSTPAPVDEAEFDQYLLGGQQLGGPEDDSDALTVERTEGVASVDPAVHEGIDYHEDFQMLDGSRGNTVCAITGVISQVMEELSASVKQRLSDLDLDSTSVHVDVMLGNDVASIIECVTDGYAPIVDVRPELPAALRQLGQTEVDAIYVRIAHDEIPGNWNALFSDDFVVPGSCEDTDEPVIAEESQPFGELDLDAFDFDLSGEGEADEFSSQSFGDELTPYSESAGDDPLSAIDFAAVVNSVSEQTQDIEQSDIEASSGSNEEAASVEDEVFCCIPEGINFSSAGDGNAELFVDFLDVFIEEGTAELEKLEDALGKWEAGDVVSTPASVSHSLHTLKGIAKGVGLQNYGTLIHNYETLLDGLAMYTGEEDKTGYFRIVNSWLDAAVRGFETIEKQRKDIQSVLPATAPMAAQEERPEEAPVDLQVSQQRSSIEGSQPKSMPEVPVLKLAPVPQGVKIPRSQNDKQLADEGAKTLANQQSIRMTAEALDKLLNLTNQAQQLGVRSSESTVRSKLAAAESLARLSAVRAHIVKISDRALSNVSAKGRHSASELDALEMDQYSELQEAANILRESVEDLDDLIHLSSRQISMAEALMKQQASVISSLGSSIQEARVVPVSRLIPGLRRIVRTVGADLGKTVSFRVLNLVGTLDRDNHARCQVILEHMVRNAMDHGIESPQQRQGCGKSATGTISIDVNKKGADYIITLSDDGRGVDPELMRETAYNKGLDIDVDALSDDEAIRLIFHKGFSTASTVSEISGRGVGMDIVLSELREIGGDIEIESTVGEGTRFHIRIPPNVSVNGALLVSAGERSFAIPLDGLIAVDYVDVDKFYDAVAQKSTLSLFGVEAQPAYLGTICHGESLPERNNAWAKSVPVLIAGSEERYMAIAVDDVKQALELVIRSLGVQFSAVPGVAGATTTADGQAVVALDLNALVKSVGSDEHTPVSLARDISEQLLVLVVDDSRTQRMVSTSQFDTLGVETITAENGMVAIDLLNTTHRLPDVILLDVEMPVKDGIQTLREIRKSVRYSDIPVIMVTSRTGAKHRALADEAGCDGYMGKPFNFPVLVAQISELTGHKLELS